MTIEDIEQEKHEAGFLGYKPPLTVINIAINRWKVDLVILTLTLTLTLTQSLEGGSSDWK